MGNLKDLPSDIILEIITRLPTESILDCKLVCKPWRNLVSHHPSFYKMYLSHLNHSPDPGELSFLVKDDSQKLYYIEYDEKHDETPIHSITRFNLTPPFTYYDIVGSINGLVCVYGGSEYGTCICNPVTREYVVLPKIKSQYTSYSRGFGYCPITNEYKVVELYRELDFIEVAVYTVGSGCGWRNVERIDIKSVLTYADYCVYVEGALHWLDESGGRISVFDLIEEKFYEHVTHPPSPPGWTIAYSNSIGVFGGVLYYAIRYVCPITGCILTEMWLLKRKSNIHEMKGRVEQESLAWSKEFTFTGEAPLAFTKSGSILCFHCGYLAVYIPRDSTLEGLELFDARTQTFPHKNTLVSLKELGEEDINILESAEIEKTESL